MGISNTARLAALALTASAGCGEGALSVPLPGQDGDRVALVFWRDARPQIELRPLTPGRPMTVDADRDRPVYTFILEPTAFIETDGRPATVERLAEVELRTEGDAPGEDECGRCLAQTLDAPQPMPAGSACVVPPFVAGAAWIADGGDTPTCAGDASGTVCAAGSAAERSELEEIRRQLRIVWPGACACRPTDAPALDGLTFTALAPTEDPCPIATWQRNAAGQFAGFGREFAALYDPTTGSTERTRLPDLSLSAVQAGVALRSGAFLIAGAAFNVGPEVPYAFYRFEPQGDGLASPTRIATETPARPLAMRYLEEDGPLYLFGTVQRVAFDPAIYACGDDDLSCTSVPLDNCPVTQFEVFPEAARQLDNGVAIARAPRALYLRPAGAGPNGVWQCQQPTTLRWREEPQPTTPPTLSTMEALGVFGNRAFACGHSEVRTCEQAQPMVITATVTDTPDADLAPDWRLTYLGPRDVSCRSIIERPAGVRVILSDATFVDFDGTGAIVGDGQLADAYGDFPEQDEIRDLGDGFTVHTGSGHRTAVAGPGLPLSLIYGPERAPTASFQAGVALADGRFVAFSRGTITWVATDNTVTTQPAPGLDFEVSAAAADPASPAAGPWRWLVGGQEGQMAIVTADGRGAEVVELDRPVTERAPIRGLAAVNDGRFVAAGPNDQLLRVDGSAVTVIPIDWDAPETERVETAPRLSGNCADPTTRPDPFRAATGGEGIAWVVGEGGLVLRVLPDRAERFSVNATPTPGQPPATAVADLSAVDAVCADVPRFGGRRQVGNFGLTTVFRLTAYASQPDDNTPRGLRLDAIGENEILGVRSFSIREGQPMGILRDGPWFSANQSGFAFALGNGFVHRMFSTRPPELWRVPFRPRMVVAAPDGSALFGTDGGRLAVSRPTGP